VLIASISIKDALGYSNSNGRESVLDLRVINNIELYLCSKYSEGYSLIQEVG
jgi:hypothetical protein